MIYKEYLKSKEWQRTRRWALDRAGNKCQLCKSDKSLDVHHNNYINIGKEEPSDVIVLCNKCHRKFHNIKEPVKLKIKYHPEAKRLIERLEQNPSDAETKMILSEIDGLNKKRKQAKEKKK